MFTPSMEDLLSEIEALKLELAREQMRRRESEQSALRHEKWANEAREEKRRLQRYFDDAGGELNLVALLDLYDERRREAVRMLDVAAERDRTLTAELDDNRRIIEAARALVDAGPPTYLYERESRLICSRCDMATEDHDHAKSCLWNALRRAIEAADQAPKGDER